jgi:acyl-CoA synthetase (AMP-forming)/AMP-acid ligase II
MGIESLMSRDDQEPVGELSFPEALRPTPGIRSVPAIALSGAERFGDRPAVMDGNVALSFNDVRGQMLAVAAALIASGIQPGDRVVLWAPNSAVWITSALGVLASGAILVPLNTRFTGREAAQVCSVVEPRFLLVAETFLGEQLVSELRSSTAPTRYLRGDVVPLPGPGEASGPGWDAFLNGASRHLDNVALDRIERIGPHDVCDIIFTSGTTGSPKGVMLRHGATLRAYCAVNESWGVAEGDRVLIGLPFFHCFGYKAGWMIDLLAGATTYPLAVFDDEKVLHLIERHQITHLPGSPTMFLPLLDERRRSRHDLSSLRAVLVGGASIPVELVRRLKDELGIDRILSGYGLTESHAIISLSRPNDPPELVATTVGKVIDGLEVRAIATDGRPVPAGAEGELMVRGFTHMTGYYGDADATAAAFTDGWLHTGDIGSVDEQGYVRITDRKKDMYIVGGFNVAPAEVENVLCACPLIGQVAVVGMPDERLGEVGAAFVVPAPGRRVAPGDVVAYARGRLANFKVPRYVEIVDRLPTNPTGKVLKGELRARLRNSRSAPVAVEASGEN